MTTTRSYTLPPDAVEAATDELTKKHEWMFRSDARKIATAAITAFIDHMVASGDMELEASRLGMIRFALILPAAKDTTT